MRSSRILVLDCGAAHLACGLFSRGGNGRLRLEQFASEPLVVDPTAESNWLFLLERALAAMVKREKFPVRECVLTVPGHLALAKLVKTPAVARDKRSRVVQFEASQNIPYQLHEVAWGYLEVADDGVDLEFMLAAAKLDVMEALCAAVEATGLRVVGCETASLALWRTHELARGAKETPDLLVDIGARSTQLIFTGAGTLHVRTLAMGGNTITQAVAAGLQLEFTVAEQIKLQVLAGGETQALDAITREAVEAAVIGFVERLQMELMRSRLSYLRQPGAVAPGRILLTGAGSRLPHLAGQLSARLELPVEKLATLPGIDLSPRASLAGADTAADQLAGLIGLAVPLVKPEVARLDLLPPSRRESQAWRRSQRWWLAAAALLVLLPVAPLIHYVNAAARLERQAAEMEAHAVPMRRIESINHANGERLEELQQQIAAIRSVAMNRANWTAFFADLQTRFHEVEDVWLDRLEVLALDEPGAGDEPVLQRLAVGGRLLDTGGNSFERAQRLFKLLGESPYIKSVQDERFDETQPGLLRYEITLVMDPANPL